MSTLGQRLGEAMQLRGISANKLDQAAGVQQYVTLLRRDKKRRPDPAIIKRIADVLHVRYEWLQFGDGPMEGTGAESELAAALQTSLEKPGPTNFDIAATFYLANGTISAQAIANVRRSSPALELSVDEIGDLLIEEQQRLIRAARARRDAARARATGTPTPKATPHVSRHKKVS